MRVEVSSNWVTGNSLRVILNFPKPGYLEARALRDRVFKALEVAGIDCETGRVEPEKEVSVCPGQVASGSLTCGGTNVKSRERAETVVQSFWGAYLGAWNCFVNGQAMPQQWHSLYGVGCVDKLTNMIDSAICQQVRQELDAVMPKPGLAQASKPKVEIIRTNLGQMLLYIDDKFVWDSNRGKDWESILVALAPVLDYNAIPSYDGMGTAPASFAVAKKEWLEKTRTQREARIANLEKELNTLRQQG